MRVNDRREFDVCCRFKDSSSDKAAYGQFAPVVQHILESKAIVPYEQMNLVKGQQSLSKD